MKADLNVTYQLFASDPAKYEDQFWKAVQKHLERATRDEDLAADAVLKVIAGLKNYEHRGCFESWLNVIARNTLASAKSKIIEDVMEASALERLASSIPAPNPIRLDLSSIVDVIDRMLAEQVIETGSIAAAAAACNLTVPAARKRLRRLGRKIGGACPLLL